MAIRDVYRYFAKYTTRRENRIRPSSEMREMYFYSQHTERT